MKNSLNLFNFFKKEKGSAAIDFILIILLLIFFILILSAMGISFSTVIEAIKKFFGLYAWWF